LSRREFGGRRRTLSFASDILIRLASIADKMGIDVGRFFIDPKENAEDPKRH
jgi:hypothetical protein